MYGVLVCMWLCSYGQMCPRVWVALREKPSGVSPGLFTLFETSLHSYLSQSRLTGPWASGIHQSLLDIYLRNTGIADKSATSATVSGFHAGSSYTWATRLVGSTFTYWAIFCLCTAVDHSFLTTDLTHYMWVTGLILGELLDIRGVDLITYDI